jgi:radical SAM/Cys-rich protein
VFDGSIRALHELNALGFGRPESPLRLDLVYNPVGAFLPAPQAELTSQYREHLARHFGIEFHDLLTITNMPIARFADQLRRLGEHDRYMGILVNHFNPETVPGLMCRSLVSVGWDGPPLRLRFQPDARSAARRSGTPDNLGARRRP